MAFAVGPVVDDQTPVRAAAQRLRNVLRLNATTSLLGGLVCVMAGGWVSTVLGTGHGGIVRVLGLGLIVFATDVAMIAGARTSRLLRWAPMVSVADGVWVVASGLTLAAGWYSTAGMIVVGIVAAMVASFGIAQLRACGNVSGRFSTLGLRQRSTKLHRSRLPMSSGKYEPVEKSRGMLSPTMSCMADWLPTCQRSTSILVLELGWFVCVRTMQVRSGPRLARCGMRANGLR